MSKVVTIRYTNGQTKKVVLGEEMTCSMAKPRGWGTECEKLVLKKDGFYHCKDCGLVFKKPIQKTKSEMTPITCDCKNLVNFLEWFYEGFFGYECPRSHYRCGKCNRVYESPYYSREAPIKLQESHAAKEHVRGHREYQKKEQTERNEEAERDARELKETLRQVSRTVRQRLLRELTT